MKNRVLLVSDMHYTTDLSEAELKMTHPEARASAASGPAFGRSQREKIDLITRAVREENDASPLDAVLILGDLSIDDYDFRRLPENYCEKFRDECMAVLPCPAYVIPGNHDSYPDGEWRRMFGTGRQYSLVIGGCLFLMTDTFADCPAHSASGSHYTPADTAFLRAELDAHPGLPAFLCAHHISGRAADDELRAFVAGEPRIQALFRGHTHLNLLWEFGGRPLADIGGYAYNGREVNGKWIFDVFDPAWAWGYEILEWDECGFSMRHRKPPLHYEGSNGSFDVPETISGEYSATFRR